MSAWDDAESRLLVALEALEVDADFAPPAMRYLRELARWNRRHNLTAIREPESMVTRHIVDSLTLLPFLGDAESLADVGSGAGLPGIPVAIARPGIDVTLVESHQRKASFLRHVQRELGLTRVSVVAERAEAFAPSRRFDTVVSRAVASLDRLVDFCAPLRAESGRLLAMKGRCPDSEIEALPEGWHAVVHPIQVPGLDEERHIIEIEKH